MDKYDLDGRGERKSEKKKKNEFFATTVRYLA